MQNMQQWADTASLAELVSFIAVAETESFSKAARQVGRDPTILSRRVRSLEQRLGVRLLERTTRKVTTTEAGTLFLARAQGIVSALQDAEQEATSRGAGEPAGTLRLSLPSTFARLWVSPFLPKFMLLHPKLRVEVELSNRFVDLVAEGFDAAIRIDALRDSGLVARKLADRRRVICASPGYLKRHGTPRRPEDLLAHACLGFTGFKSHPLWHLTSTTGERVSLRVDGPLVADDAETVLEAALADLGIAVMADWLVGKDLGRRLVTILPKWTMEGRGAIHAVIPSHRFVPTKTRAFLDWVAPLFARPPWTRRPPTR